MKSEIIETNSKKVTIKLEVEFSSSMLKTEEAIQQALNQAGILATQEAIKKFDTDGSPLIIGKIKYTSKSKKINRDYESPYGKVSVERFVYQTSAGGKIFCPLEERARMIGSATPLFAKIISSKYADKGAKRVQTDLRENHGRNISKSFLQDTAEYVGTIAQTKEESWHYEIPKINEPVKAIAIGVDGTCMYITEEGYRQAMVGTIALYNFEGKRLHTTYIAAAPEYGKETFINRVKNEIQKIKEKYPTVEYIGIADGAPDNWTFLEKHTSKQILDFYHTTEYVTKVANVLFGTKKNEVRTKWLKDECHSLKHENDYAEILLEEMKKIKKEKDLSKENEELLNQSITYFKNHKHQMGYAKNVKNKLPIGSGVTEAACKVIIKQRLCCSGMKWKSPGAKVVLSLRCLNYTDGRWQQFWSKIDQYGVPYELQEVA